MSSTRRLSNRPEVLAQFAVKKYSHAITAVDHSGPVNWSHIHANGDLFVAFERDPSAVLGAEQKFRLRVVHGRNTLEELDLNSLAREAAQHAFPRQPRNVKPLVAVIVKLPCLAVRYPSRTEQICRFQLKFSSDRDYYSALAIFSDIKCPFTEPSASRATSLRPDSASSQITTPTASTFVSTSDWRNHESPPIDLSSRTYASGSRSTIDSVSGSGPSTTSSTSPLSSHLYSKERLGSKPTTQHPSSENTPSFYGQVPLQVGDRPVTAPILSVTQSLDPVLPPKRVLPFSRPGLQVLHAEQLPSSGVLPTSNDLMKESPRPEAGTISSGAPVFTSSRPQTARSRTTAPAISSPARRLDLELEDRRWNHYSDRLAPVPASSPLLPSSAPLGQTSSPKAPSAHLQREGLRAPGIPSNLSNTVLNQPVPPHESQVEGVRSLASMPTSSQPVLYAADLSSYMQTPESERSQLVNNWICQQLEDDGFRTLCQDIEQVWRRMAFGS